MHCPVSTYHFLPIFSCGIHTANIQNWNLCNRNDWSMDFLDLFLPQNASLKLNFCRKIVEKFDSKSHFQIQKILSMWVWLFFLTFFYICISMIPIFYSPFSHDCINISSSKKRKIHMAFFYNSNRFYTKFSVQFFF